MPHGKPGEPASFSSPRGGALCAGGARPTGIAAVGSIFEVLRIDCHPSDVGYSAFRVECVMRTLVRRGSGVCRPAEHHVFLEPVKYPNQSESHGIDVDEYEAARGRER
jgi:hypothetical protein